MNANQRFFTYIVAYLAYFVSLMVVSGLLADAAQLWPALPGWAGIILFGVLVVWPLPLLLHFFNRTPGWKRRVQMNGRLAAAQIMTVRDTGVSTGSMTAASVYVDLSVRVTPRDEPAFDGALEVLASRIGLPSPGEVILVRYDPADHHHVALARDLGAVSVIDDTQRDASALAARITSGPTGVLVNQLHELEDMHRSGSLSEQEFRIARKRLLA